MSYAKVISDKVVVVINLETGETIQLMSDDSRYSRALDLIKEGKEADVFSLDFKHVITSFFEMESDTNCVEWNPITIKIERGCGVVTLHEFDDMQVELSTVLTNKILSMSEQGFDCQPLLNFVSNLYKNPSKVAIDELYLFADACKLPITEDGCMIAYKVVNSDYTDCHTGTIDNSVGQIPSMPRGLVDADRDNICSYGLHFCSKDYLKHFGGKDRRCMLVKINPADVVSIPSDHNNAKGRTWTYEVVGELPDGWMDDLADKDYTSSAVVANNGQEVVKADKLPFPVDAIEEKYDFDEIQVILECNDYAFSSIIQSWEDDWGNTVPVEDVSFDLDISVEHLNRYADYILSKEDSVKEVECPECGSQSFNKKGFNHDGSKQRYKCKNCGTNFYI